MSRIPGNQNGQKLPDLEDSKILRKAVTVKKGGALGRLGGSVRRTFDFDSGHDLTARELTPHVRLSAASVESAWDPQPPSLSK